MNKINKYHLLLLSFLVIFGSLYYFKNKKEKTSEEIIISLREYLLSAFLNELPGINKKLPHKIDDQTTLLSVNYENNKIISVYEISSATLSVVLLDKIKPLIIKQACADDMKRNLLAVDVDFLDKYKNPTGDILFEISLSNSLCSKL